MRVDSAIIYTPDGTIAMVVHIDNEPYYVAEAKITTDPAFNPDWGIQTRMPREVYDSCASDYDVMTQTIAIINAASLSPPDLKLGRTVSMSDAHLDLASALQDKLDAIDAANAIQEMPAAIPVSDDNADDIAEMTAP